MFSFKNDYSEGAHPRILEALSQVNLQQDEGYGEDRFSLAAIATIKQLIGSETADVHMLVGGTQTNLIALSAFLRPHEAAIAAATGHISVHETGAIEATGHKVLAAEAMLDGKLTVAAIQKVLDAHGDEHMVKPRLVYLSDTTEIGGVYTKAELTALSRYCHAHQLLLYLDGARLGSALSAAGNDVSLADLPQLTDAFYIGGTKNGALLGEALVICNPALQADFRYLIKQKGALLAKGRLLGIQFTELFRDGLFFELAGHANQMAARLSEAITGAGFSFLTEPKSNQIFPIFPDRLVTALEHEFGFMRWQKFDGQQTAIRLVTSWATTEEAVAAFTDFLTVNTGAASASIN
ncbi:MAG: beta-eliminating lyase-related protein [Sporolactobacillus sp.]